MNVIMARPAALLLMLAAMLPVSTDAQYSIAFGEGARGASGVAGDYRFVARLRAEWFEMVREIPLGSSFSLGLGVHLGSPELRLRTVESPGVFDGRHVDLNRWLSLDARLEFHDIQPYARLRYRAGREDRGIGLRVDAGLRLLKVENLSLELGGPMAVELAGREGLLAEYERETRADLEDYYVEPLIRVELNYRFG